MEGYLVKEGHFFLSWKKRWFVLSENKLIYYVDESKKSEKGSHIIDIDSTVNSVADHGGMKFLFALQAKGINNSDVLVMSASNDEEKQKWINAIRDVIKKFKLSL